ncbi:hypothetical protein LINPERHAP1_LOCUS24404 [Linum perenne]
MKLQESRFEGVGSFASLDQKTKDLSSDISH